MDDTEIESDHRRRRAIARLAAGAVTGCLIAGVCGFALHANTIALIDGYRAAEGIAGTPGEAVVTAVEHQRDGQVCFGHFAPEDGGATVDARIEVPGECRVGQEIEALLAPAHTSPFVGDERPRAWAPGARDWGLFVPFVMIFAIVCAVGAVLIVRCLGGCRSVLQAGSRDMMLGSEVPKGGREIPAGEAAREQGDGQGVKIAYGFASGSYGHRQAL